MKKLKFNTGRKWVPSLKHDPIQKIATMLFSFKHDSYIYMVDKSRGLNFLYTFFPNRERFTKETIMWNYDHHVNIYNGDAEKYGKNLVMDDPDFQLTPIIDDSTLLDNYGGDMSKINCARCKDDIDGCVKNETTVSVSGELHYLCDSCILEIRNMINLYISTRGNK